MAAVGACTLSGYAEPAFAHHSGAFYDTGQRLELTGTVKAFRWSNPHVEIRLLADGPGAEWRIEASSPTVLARSGWTRRALRSGDKVTVTLNPHRSGERTGLLVRVVSNGRVIGDAAPAG
jgi:hypothetical protein